MSELGQACLDLAARLAADPPVPSINSEGVGLEERVRVLERLCNQLQLSLLLQTKTIHDQASVISKMRLGTPLSTVPAADPFGLGLASVTAHDQKLAEMANELKQLRSMMPHLREGDKIPVLDGYYPLGERGVSETVRFDEPIISHVDEMEIVAGSNTWIDSTHAKTATFSAAYPRTRVAIDLPIGTIHMRISSENPDGRDMADAWIWICSLALKGATQFANVPDSSNLREFHMWWRTGWNHKTLTISQKAKLLTWDELTANTADRVMHCKEGNVYGIIRIYMDSGVWRMRWSASYGYNIGTVA